jgi:hypothetical protein
VRQAACRRVVLRRAAQPVTCAQAASRRQAGRRSFYPQRVGFAVVTPAVLDGLSSTWADVQRDEFAAAKAAIDRFETAAKREGLSPSTACPCARRSARLATQRPHDLWMG